jgi:hypothetical protein
MASPKRIEPRQELGALLESAHSRRAIVFAIFVGSGRNIECRRWQQVQGGDDGGGGGRRAR